MSAGVLHLPRSVSGVRPLLAFGSIGLGFAAVLLQVLLGVESRTRPTPALASRDGAFKEPLRYELCGRDGEVLARSLPRWALVASPFNLWMRHTPERIAGRLAEALGESGPEAVLQRLVPTDAEGDVVVHRWPLAFDEAVALREWIDRGGPRDDGTAGRLPGFDLVRHRPETKAERALLDGVRGPYFTLSWRPDQVLSQATRERFAPQLIGKRGAPQRWVARLAKDLFPLLDGARERERRTLMHASAGLAPGVLDAPHGWTQVTETTASPRGIRGWIEALAVRLGAERERALPGDWIVEGTPAEWVFGGLCPTRYAVVRDPLEPELVAAVRAALEAEEVGPFEAWLEPTAERRYPVGELAVLGRWGWIERRDEQGEPRLEHGPLEGLESVGLAALERLAPAFAQRHGGSDARSLEFLSEGRPDAFHYEHKVPRRGWRRAYYRGVEGGFAPARIETTIDLGLQRFVAARLDELARAHDPALAMAVAIDLGTRDVLALDWVDAYGCVPFAPLQHQFTPGSTFKLVTMALALEGGHVTPDERFDVGHAGWYAVANNPDGTGRRRVIREAEGFATGLISAAECVAHSSNAGMVQIGLRVAPETWVRETRAFGYGMRAATELLAPGMYNPSGRVGEERDDPRVWDRTRSHASVSFGDAVSTNLLQHAEVIAGLLGGGVGQPLRFARAVSSCGERVELPAGARRRLIGRATSDQLREMLRLGAAEGTGEDLERPSGMVLGTKTGTTEKLEFDVCQHRFGAAWREHLASGGAWDGAAVHADLRGRFREDRSCYVSSIAAFAADPSGEREVLVLVVVDDAHGQERFGSKVAGPAAVAILSEALGWTHLGETPSARLAGGLVASDGELESVGYEPWAERRGVELGERPWWRGANDRSGEVAR